MDDTRLARLYAYLIGMASAVGIYNITTYTEGAILDYIFIAVLALAIIFFGCLIVFAER